MARDISLEEARDEQIAKLAEKHYLSRMTLLRMGDQVIAAGVGALVSAEFSDQLMDQLVVLAASDERQAGAMFADLVKKAMRADAEVDAVRDVEQLEKDRAEAADEARVEQAQWAKAGA